MYKRSVGEKIKGMVEIEKYCQLMLSG